MTATLLLVLLLVEHCPLCSGSPASGHHGLRLRDNRQQLESLTRHNDLAFGILNDDLGGRFDSIAEKNTHKAATEPPKKVRPLMNRINQMRAQLCWTRPDLWNHEDCLKFLGLKCSRSSTGQGVCGQFKDGVKERCENEERKLAREAYCKLARKLKIATKWDKEAPAPAPTPAPEPEKEPAEPKEPEVPKEQDAVEEQTEQEAEEAAQDGKLEKGQENKTARAEAENADRDGDGYPNEDDLFPDDAKEWFDLDLDGIGDNNDPDLDGDGVKNHQDTHPRDAKRFTNDNDGDSHINSKDAFPDDPSEYKDFDGDGIGDSKDPDRDNDGVPNPVDWWPDDPTRFREDAPPDFPDTDGDGVPDCADEFPRDPKEWKDSDGDGVGDNADAFPNDAKRWKAPCSPEEEAAPTAEPAEEEVDPNEPFNKVEKPLPDQGYDEHSEDRVEHNDQETATSDWRTEWPISHKSEEQIIKRICEESPDNAWCKRYKKNLRFTR